MSTLIETANRVPPPPRERQRPADRSSTERRDPPAARKARAAASAGRFLRAMTIARVLAAEAERIAAATKGFLVVALDERGEAWATSQLAEKLRGWRDDASPVAFVIGSADGLAGRIKRDANVIMALSALTLPHGLARIVLVEQIYRAASLLRGHPYHRE